MNKEKLKQEYKDIQEKLQEMACSSNMCYVDTTRTVGTNGGCMCIDRHTHPRTIKHIMQLKNKQIEILHKLKLYNFFDEDNKSQI